MLKPTTPKKRKPRTCTLEQLENRKLMAGDMMEPMDGEGEDCPIQVYEIDRERVFPEALPGPLAGRTLTWRDFYPGFPTPFSSNSGDESGADEAELNAAGVSKQVVGADAVQLDEVLIGLTPPTEAITGNRHSIGQDLRGAAEFAAAVDAILGGMEVDRAELGLGSGASLEDQLSGPSTKSPADSLVPDPTTGLTEREQNDNDPYAGIRPSFDLGNHASGIAGNEGDSSGETPTEPYIVPGTEHKRKVEGGMEESYTRSDGTNVTNTVTETERGGVRATTTEDRADGSWSITVTETDPEYIHTSRTDRTSGGAIIDRNVTRPWVNDGIDRTQDPNADGGGGVSISGAGENVDLSLKDPDKVNPGDDTEGTVEAPQLSVNPRDLLINPDPDAAHGPKQDLGRELPPLKSPDRVLPPTSKG